MKKNNKNSGLWGFVGVFCLIIVVSILGMLLWKPVRGVIAGDKYLSSPQATLQPDGFYVYYPVSAYFRKNELIIKTPGLQYVTVANIKENLEITVNDKWNGTILVVEHWQDKVRGIADSAKLFVRTEEHKVKWEKAIQEALEKQEEKPKPQDIWPSSY